MAFDLASAKPVTAKPATASAPPGGGFDLSSARPVAPPAAPAAPAEPANNDNILGRVVGSVEPLLTLGSSMVGNIAGNIYGIGKSVANGQYGTPEGARAAKATAEDLANRLTIKPTTDTGRAGVQWLSELAEPLEGLQGIPGADALRMGANAATAVGGLRTMAGVSAAAQGAQDAAAVAGAGKLSAGKLADLVRAPKPAMAGVGAASTAEEALRAERFANMRAPMKPTKGILSRSMDDVQFEREAAKRPEGKALDQRFADLNKGMEQHMDALVDETGAQASSLRATGKAVNNAIEMKHKAKKAEVDKAYTAANNAPESAELVDVQPLLDFVGKNRSAARNAGIIHSIEDETNRLSGGTGKVSVKDMEELRKMVNNLAEPGTPNGVYGKQAIDLIDKTTEGKGGPLYQQARRLNENMMKEFSDRDVIDKMLRTKRGTKDRAVAYEDVADHVLMDGSLDDMKHVFRVLEAHPAGTAPEIVAAGQQAARELRGAAAAKLKERMFSNDGADTAGKTVGSSAQINRIVNELDKDGKLEFLFGKTGASEIRDTAQVAKDLYTTPKGSVNSSNTASAMEKVLDRMATGIDATPIVGKVLGPTARYLSKRVESRNYSKRVDAALEPRPLSDMAGGR